MAVADTDRSGTDVGITHVATLEEFAELVGASLGPSSWITVEQDRVNTFADATDDHQWIHVDPERAAAESPYGAPIAHGYLTLSLLVPMWYGTVVIDSVTTTINYGLNKVRFTGPVRVGDRIRLVGTFASIEELPKGGVQVVADARIEVEGADRPAVIAEAIFRMSE